MVSRRKWWLRQFPGVFHDLLQIGAVVRLPVSHVCWEDRVRVFVIWKENPGINVSLLGWGRDASHTHSAVPVKYYAIETLLQKCGAIPLTFSPYVYLSVTCCGFRTWV